MTATYSNLQIFTCRNKVGIKDVTGEGIKFQNINF